MKKTTPNGLKIKNILLPLKHIDFNKSIVWKIQLQNSKFESRPAKIKFKILKNQHPKMLKKSKFQHHLFATQAGQFQENLKGRS